jgi:hypothetical protein
VLRKPPSWSPVSLPQQPLPCRNNRRALYPRTRNPPPPPLPMSAAAPVPIFCAGTYTWIQGTIIFVSETQIWSRVRILMDVVMIDALVSGNK